MPEAVGPALLAAWQTFWALNKKLAQDVVKLCTASAEERLAHTTRKADLRTFSATQKDLGRVAKSNFRPAQQKDLTQCTLFLVEGKSAGGCAIQARDPKTQAVLSLRGKILNVLRTSHTKALANAEIATLLSVLGYSDKDPTWTSRTYKEVVLLVDPDEDGGHISILLLGFFLKYAPGILQERRLLRVTDAALFKAYVNGKYTFGRTLQDVRSKVSASAHITRIKGWGEIDPDTLRFVGMAPATRQLIRIAAPPPYAASLIKTLLSSGTESLKARRLLLGLPPKAPFDSSMDNLELDMA
jgi:DNA gyrase subunit B